LQALTKFLKCVLWEDESEKKQALDLLASWVNIDIDDALELLGPYFEEKQVRDFGVLQLQRYSPQELDIYLLQLCQSLKFENLKPKNVNESALCHFLVTTAIHDMTFGNNFYWSVYYLHLVYINSDRFLMVECEDSIYGKLYAKVAYEYMKGLVEVRFTS
jgi:phosphatidylinositol 3-kinase